MEMIQPKSDYYRSRQDNQDQCWTAGHTALDLARNNECTESIKVLGKPHPKVRVSEYLFIIYLFKLIKKQVI